MAERILTQSVWDTAFQKGFDSSQEEKDRIVNLAQSMVYDGRPLFGAFDDGLVQIFPDSPLTKSKQTHSPRFNLGKRFVLEILPQRLRDCWNYLKVQTIIINMHRGQVAHSQLQEQFYDSQFSSKLAALAKDLGEN